MMVAYFLMPIYTLSKIRQLISDRMKGPLVAMFRSPLMKALDRSVETLGLWIVTSMVTFIKSLNQSNIKPCLIVHLVAMWTLIYLISITYHFKGQTLYDHDLNSALRILTHRNHLWCWLSKALTCNCFGYHGNWHIWPSNILASRDIH